METLKVGQQVGPSHFDWYPGEELSLLGAEERLDPRAVTLIDQDIHFCSPSEGRCVQVSKR